MTKNSHLIIYSVDIWSTGCVLLQSHKYMLPNTLAQRINNKEWQQSTFDTNLRDLLSG